MPKRQRMLKYKVNKTKRNKRAKMSKTNQVARALTRKLPNLRLGGLLGIELKYLDHGMAITPIGNTLAIFPPTLPNGGSDNLLGVERGTGPSNRDGSVISLRELFFTYAIAVGAIGTPQSLGATGIAHGQVLVTLVLDTQCNGATPNITDIYKNTSNDPNTVVVPLRNIEFSSRFKVLYRKVHNLTNYDASFVVEDVNQPNGGPWKMPGDIRTFKKRINLTGMKMTYKQDSNSGNVDNITDNCLYCICSATNTVPLIGLAYNSRLRFVG